MVKPHKVKVKRANPATALPWKYQAEGRVQFGILGSARLPVPQRCSQNNQADAAYIAHAANAYPKLVEQLQSLADSHSELEKERGSQRATHTANARALLRELGEES